MSHNIFKFPSILFASNQKARRDFQACAISGNSKGVVRAKSDNCCNNSQAFSPLQSIVSNETLVCSISQASFTQVFHKFNNQTLKFLTIS
jgi:hypothetical protein